MKNNRLHQSSLKVTRKDVCSVLKHCVGFYKCMVQFFFFAFDRVVAEKSILTASLSHVS